MHEEFERLHERLDHFHTHLLNLEEKLNKVLSRESTIKRMEYRIMDELGNLTTKVEETATVEQSAIVLLQGLKTALDAAGTDPAKLAALSASLDTNRQQLADAITANTPADPGTGGGEPPPPPPPAGRK